MHEMKRKPAEIWAVAGGKGGTGKTFVISNLALHLALQNRKTILVDGDFGGPNLHSCFGVKRPKQSLTDFFDKKVSLERLLIQTDIPGLSLIPGNMHSLSSEGIQFTQKVKLFRHVRKLAADYVLLDLGGGTSFHTVDTFLLADKMLVVIIPEVTAIDNMYHFIKSVLFRKLKMLLAMHGLKHLAQDKWNRRKELNIRTLQDLIDSINGDAPVHGHVIREELENFRINIVLNQVRTGDQVPIGVSLRSICRKYLRIDAAFSGYVNYDSMFWKAGQANGFHKTVQRYPQLVHQMKDLINNLTENKPLGISGV